MEIAEQGYERDKKYRCVGVDIDIHTLHQERKIQIYIYTFNNSTHTGECICLPLARLLLRERCVWGKLCVML